MFETDYIILCKMHHLVIKKRDYRRVFTDNAIHFRIHCIAEDIVIGLQALAIQLVKFLIVKPISKKF